MSKAQVAAFKEVADVLDANGVLWWLSDGAVLGCIRDGGFVRTDPDVDIAFWKEDQEIVEQALLTRNWQISKKLDQKLVLHKVVVDFHAHDSNDDEAWYDLLNGELQYVFPKRLLENLERRKFLGRDVWVPSPPEEYLVVHYGEDWETPNPNWLWHTDPPCLRRNGE